MKKIWIFLVTALLLTGCAAQETFETVGDAYGPQELPPPQELRYTVPQDAAAPVMNGSGDCLYFCQGYELMAQTLPGGDMDATFRAVTGYSGGDITVMETVRDGVARYECVWTSAGELGDEVGHGVILDDGIYHYCLSVMAPEQEAGSLQQTWQEILGSFTLKK